MRHVERLIEELEYHRVCPGKMRVRLCHADGPDGLGDTALDPRGQELARLKRDVNARVGRFALRSGTTLPLEELYRDGSHGYEICDVRGKMYF